MSGVDDGFVVVVLVVVAYLRSCNKVPPRYAGINLKDTVYTSHSRKRINTLIPTASAVTNARFFADGGSGGAGAGVACGASDFTLEVDAVVGVDKLARVSVTAPSTDATYSTNNKPPKNATSVKCEEYNQI